MTSTPEPVSPGHDSGRSGGTRLDRLLRSRLFPRAFQIALLVGLAGVALLAYRPPQHSEMNVGAAVVWQIWWALLPLSVLFLSRIWCAICPFSLLTDIAESSVLSRRLELSPRSRRFLPWLAVVGLLVLGFVFLLSALEANGGMTAALLVSFAAVSLLTGFLWRGKIWCRYLCPVGLMMGLYARLGWLRLRPVTNQDTARAARAARRCPAGTSPISPRISQDCLLCGSCLHGPDGSAVAVRLAVPALSGQALRTAEGAAVSLLFGLLVADVLRMTPLYLGYMSRAVPVLKGNYELAMALGMAGVLALIVLVQSGASLLAFSDGSFLGRLVAISGVLLPLALAVQLALSAQHLMITPEVVRNLGAELGLLAHGHIPPSGAYYWIWPLKLLGILAASAVAGQVGQ